MAEDENHTARAALPPVVEGSETSASPSPTEANTSSDPTETDPLPPRTRHNLSLNTKDLDPQPPPRDSRPPVRTETYSPTALRRRATTRNATFRNVEDYDDFDHTYSARPGWEPGAEPGYDPKLPDGGHSSMPALSAECEITVVDFSKNRMIKRNFENASFIRFLEEPKEDWAKCRWINVNGLSWDVIQAIGHKKGLHKLALEDIMNIQNRTKTDW